MKVYTPEISWHERDPIYTCSFHPTRAEKFATAGVTGTIRLWEITDKIKDNKQTTGIGLNSDIDIVFVANLKRHTKSVNVVRWNNDGSVLASAGDEAVIFLWKENDIKNQKTLDADDDESKENWFSFKCFRGHLEDILDISWSKDSSTLISGSVDNSVIIWNVASGSKLAILKEPKGFVQGVVYDPLNQIYACLSTDRSLRIYSASNNKCLHNVNKIQISKENPEQPGASIRMYHDDTMKSFFRRMCFSPDGNLLFTPAGCLDIDLKTINVSFIYKKNCYTKPCLYLPHDKPSVAISVCPLKFELNKKTQIKNEEKYENLFNLPYRYVFAVATEDSVYLYDTQNLTPFAYATGIHYSNLSDLSWSNDGRILIIASIDGFCSFVTFSLNELGVEYVDTTDAAMEMESTNTKTTLNTNEIVSKPKDAIQVDKIEPKKQENNLMSDVIVLQNKTDNQKSNSKRVKLIPL